MNAHRPPRQTPGTEPRLVVEVEPVDVGEKPPAAKSQTPAPRKSGSQDGQPRYRTMARMEARIRHDQVTELAKLRRAVAANRTDKSERITDNTLVRIAVDLLLSHRELLEGNTEEELRASVVASED